MHHQLREPGILYEKQILHSVNLAREVKLEIYSALQADREGPINLLLINDGQNLAEMGFESLVEEFAGIEQQPFLFVGVHAGPDRKHEYGIAGIPDYKGRGDRASAYTAFITGELIPFLQKTYRVSAFGRKAIAGFSLGGLTALDIAWRHPQLFHMAGAFSGSLWWRSLAQEDKNYSDDKHRIMHQLIRNGDFKPGMKFYFQCGNKDETKDRNNNGIIDSIDDTLDLVRELEAIGYKAGDDIRIVLMEDGRHDIETWGKAMPDFLAWMSMNFK